MRVLTLCSLVTTPPEPVLEGQWVGPASCPFSKAWGAPDCSLGQMWLAGLPPGLRSTWPVPAVDQLVFCLHRPSSLSEGCSTPCYLTSARCQKPGYLGSLPLSE